MKYLISLLFLISAFTSHAQRTMFGSNNNYVAPSSAAFQAPAIVTTDLLLNLDAENPSSYPGTGNIWYDLSTNVNNGTISNNQMPNTASAPKKFTFNGTSDNVSFVSSKFNTPYAGKTVMVAAKMDANFGTIRYRALFGNLSPRNFNLYIYNDGSNYQIHFSAGSWGLSDVLSLVTGQWYVFAATQDANTIRYYLNGVAVGSTTSAPLQQYQSSSNEFLGMADNYWYGDINTALIYKRCLSPAEILQNFDALKSRFGL